MSTIITKNSATSGSTPSSLVQGELAINVTDGKLFYGSGSGNVVREFTGSGGGGGTVNTGSFVTTSSFNAYTGSNTSQFAGTASYATNALSASYAPDTTFPYTGSAGITGSLTVVGKTQSTQIGAGAAPSGSVPLDVRAQGALSTDLALRVRNSADTKNIFKVQGDGNAYLGEETDSGQKSFFINTYNNPRLVLDTGLSTDTGVISITRRYYATVTVFNDNALLLSHNPFSDGNNIPYKHHYVNPSTYYGSVPAHGYNAGFMYFKDSATIANLQMKLSPDNALSIYTSSASPIETIITGSAFQLWASGSLGNAKPYIRTQNGTLLYLGDQSLLYNVTASSITSSFTGSLLGTASYATNAISASYTPLTIGTTAITSGTDTRLLYQNAGVVSQSARMTFDGTKFIYDGTSATANASIFEILGTGGQRGLWVYQDNSAKIGGNNNYFVTKGTGTGQATNNFYSNDSHFCFGGVDSTKGWVHIGANNNNPQAKLDIRAQGALSTDIAFRVRNSANSANLGAIYGNGTVNLGNSNFNFQSTETSGRTAVIGSSNTGASYSTYSILSILGHNNSIASYGHTSYVGINSSINQNSGGTVTGMGESNTLVGGTIGIGMNNNIAGSANSNMNTGIGYNNAIQYEKKNTFLLGNNLRITAAGNASMTKIGWANSAGTLAQIDRSFEVYLNGQSGSDFHVTGKTNVVLKNNSVLVSGTNYEAAATNTLTIHNGVAPITNITGAFQLYSTASTAGNAKPYFRTENGTILYLGDQSLLYNVTASSITSSFTGSLLGTASYALNALSASYAPSTPAFPYTGSAGITGSLTVVGKTQSTQIGAGTSPSGSVPLDVRAQGALSTDLAFRVRNSADNKTIMEVRGNEETRWNGLPVVGNYVAIKNYTSYDATIDLMGGDGVKAQIFHDVNSNANLNRGLNLWNPGIVGSSTAKINNIVKSGLEAYGDGYGFNWAFTSNASGIYTQSERAMWLTPYKSLVFYTGSSSPIDVHSEKTGSFEIFASASTATAGVAAHFITNAGTTSWIGRESRLFNVTASSITSSFTGSLQGTASFATQALSASYAPSTPAFPYTGSAGITGSLTVVGPTTSTQIGAGAAPTVSVPLDVRAQGALSTDLAFRVRNSANSSNIITVAGDGGVTHVGRYGLNTAPNAAIDFYLSGVSSTYGFYAAGSYGYAAISSAPNTTATRHNFYAPFVGFGGAYKAENTGGGATVTGTRIGFAASDFNANTYDNIAFQASISNTGGGLAIAVDSTDNAHFRFGTISGSKFGTATTQKIGFWNTTPIVQPTASTAIDTLLTNIGLRAAGGNANFDTPITSSIILNGTSSAPSLNTTANVTTIVGSNTIYSIPTASYDGAWFEYTVRSGSNARAGQIMSIWSGSSVNFTETTTTDFGTTAGIAFTVMVSGSNLILTGSSATAGWTVKTIVRSI
jgi:hypothetical protein